MIIIIGLVVLIAAVIIGVAGVAANSGEITTSPSNFAVFDYHFTASAGELLLAGMLGLSLLLAGVWRSARRNSATRRELRQSRREMAAARTSTPPSGSVPPAGSPPPTTKPVVSKPVAPPPGAEQTAPSTKPVWSWNRFMRQPTGEAPVEKTGRTAVTTQTTK
jgi:hypothetical protein